MRELRGPTAWSFRGFKAELDEGERLRSRLPWVITLLPFILGLVLRRKVDECAASGRPFSAWLFWGLGVPFHAYVHTLIKLGWFEFSWR